MTPQVAAFLLSLLDRQQVQVAAPDFDATVALIQQARRALQAIVEKPA